MAVITAAEQGPTDLLQKKNADKPLIGFLASK